ncbi:hypothetical protein D3C73_1636040 [compost metagenome]
MTKIGAVVAIIIASFKVSELIFLASSGMEVAAAKPNFSAADASVIIRIKNSCTGSNDGLVVNIIAS